MLVNPCFCLAIFLALFFTHITAIGLNHTNFRLKISSYNAATRLLDSKLRKVSVADVIGAAQIKPLDAADFMRQTPWYLKGYRWAQSSTPDESTVEWLPQGITTSHDTGENRGIVQGHSDVVVVSWNDERNKTGGATKAGQGVRVTFVRKGATDGAPTNRAYIHALLVEPFLDSSGEPDFRVLENVISGGIVWRGNWFYVTDDKSGVRVFDLGMIWKVNDGGDKVGRDGNEFLGGTYPFVIPQAYTYTPVLGPGIVFTPSFASLDRNSTPPCLMLGETVLPRDNSTVARFPLDDKTDLLVPDSSNTTLTSAVWAWEINIHNVQGLVFANENYWITGNDGDDVNSDIYRWSPGSWSDEHLSMLPAGVQGIAYKPAGEELWMVGSVPGKRYVMAISTTMKNLTRLTDGDQGQSSGVPKTTEVATPPAQGRGLGPGGITGVVIGVLAGLAAVTGTGFLVLRKQRKDNGGTEVMSEDKWLKPELGPGVKGAELPGQLARERQEMAAGEMAVELPLSPSRKGADHAWPQ